MVPKDFKDRIVTTAMDQEVKLNYLKWLTQGLEIDMFEILTILTLYSRGSLHERLKILYSLYCFQDDKDMNKHEFEYLIGKISTSIGSTITVKKSLLHDLAEIGKPKLIPDKEYIT